MQGANSWKQREELNHIPNEYNNFTYFNMLSVFEYVCKIRNCPAEDVLEELLKELSEFNIEKRKYLQRLVDNRIGVLISTGKRDTSPITYRDYLGVFSIFLYEVSGKICFILNQFIREAETTRKNHNESLNNQSQEYNKDGKPLKTVVEFVFDNPFTEERESRHNITNRNE